MLPNQIHANKKKKKKKNLYSMEILYTQSLSLDNFNHDLSTLKGGIWKREIFRSLVGGRRW